MTIRLTACAMTVALLAGTGAFAIPAAAGNAVTYNENAYGYSGGGYVGGHSVTGLMDVAVEPMAMAAVPVSRTAHWNYCAARYQSFDPASDTFLASDGNRYFCR